MAVLFRELPFLAWILGDPPRVMSYSLVREAERNPFLLVVEFIIY
jgi:hypothetical protein